MSYFRKLLVLLPAILLSSSAYSLPLIDFDSLPTIDPDLPTIRYVTFETPVPNPQLSPPLLPVPALTERGQFRLPANTSGQNIPAVVILHGSLGPDSRGSFYADALNDAGIATLELDFYGARDKIASIDNRPNDPREVMPDVYGALRFLASQQGIDPNRIGLMGFSAGGVLTVTTATGANASSYTSTLTNSDGSKLKYAAYVAQYPVCWVYNVAGPGFAFTSLAGEPLMIQTGEFDSYNPPASCQNLVTRLPPSQQSLLTVNVYPKAFHGWDRLQPPETVADPFARFGYGPHGIADVRPNVPLAVLSRTRIVNFFSNIFGI